MCDECGEADDDLTKCDKCRAYVCADCLTDYHGDKCSK